MTWERRPYTSKPKSSKKGYWYVYFYKDHPTTGQPTRHRIRFKTEAEASKKCDDLTRAHSKGGYSSLLSDPELAEYRTARKLLGSRFPNVGLPEIVQDWLRRQPDDGDPTFQEFVEQYLESDEFKRKAPKTRSNETPFYKRLGLGFKDSLAKNVSFDDLRDHLDRRGKVDGVDAVTRNNEMRKIKTLYSWGTSMERGRNRLTENPAIHLKTAPEPPRQYPCLTVPQVQKLFRQAEEHDPALLPALALCFFAGIRPELEIKRLSATPQNIVPQKKQILLKVGQAKIRAKARLIEKMPDNLWKWLSLRVSSEGHPVVDTTDWSKRRQRLFILAGIKASGHKLPNSISRHTFASYAFKHKAIPVEELMKVMGHSKQEMTDRYTSNMITEEEAESYFTIVPSRQQYDYTKHKRGSLKDSDQALILSMILGGKTNKWIGDQYGVTEAAVRKFRERHGFTKRDFSSEIFKGLRHQLESADPQDRERTIRHWLTFEKPRIVRSKGEGRG